jgi:hypothetical protein
MDKEHLIVGIAVEVVGFVFRKKSVQQNKLMGTRVGDIRARFEETIAQNAAKVPETGGMYLAARLAKQQKCPIETTRTTGGAEVSTTATRNPQEQQQQAKRSLNSSNHHLPPKSPTKTRHRGCPASERESVSSRTVSMESDASSSVNSDSTKPRQNSTKERFVATRRASICPKRTVDIPQSIHEDKEAIACPAIVLCGTDQLNGSLVFPFDDDASISVASPRRSSMVSLVEDCEQSRSSRGSTLSRSSPQIQRLPRDVDFDSDDSSMSEDEAEGLGKYRRGTRRQQQQQQKPIPKPRYW